MLFQANRNHRAGVAVPEAELQFGSSLVQISPMPWTQQVAWSKAFPIRLSSPVANENNNTF